MHVLVQKCQHCIPVKILDQSDKGAFSYKFYPSYFFIYFYLYIIFHLFLRPLNTLSTSFRAKMETLLSGRNSRPFWTRGIFVQILHKFFFLSFEGILHFFVGPQNMPSTSFGTKMMALYSSQNSWPVEQNGIFVQILPDLFYYSFFLYRIFHLFLRPLNILSTIFHVTIMILHSGRNYCPVGIRGIFLQILHEFFFFWKYFQFFF